MRRITGIFLAAVLLLCVFAGSSTVNASTKTGSTRAIAIVFDNSGSMYMKGEQAWCRATYAMEVFASMLNQGDTLLIYPMHPITVGKTQYTMENPFRVTDPSQAASIRDIYTEDAQGTPIESVDAATQGLQSVRADKKYMIVLTDGKSFYKDGVEMSKSETKRQLESRFQEQISGKTMTVMYLGIGSDVVMPDIAQSEYFAKKQAKNSQDVLSALTDMCNLIFGRDVLPANHLSGNNVDFDISMSKLIVFVQGENVSDLTVTGDAGAVGTLQSTTATKYGTAGCGNYKSVPDTSLQGMMVTYTDCAAGNYTIHYSGTSTSIEVYYEPDADLDFVFTDANGQTVASDALYEGDYKVSFGLKDAKTGKLISSDLLGNPQYQGSYLVNGEEHPFSHEGHSGDVPVSLSINDTFEAGLTVTYLSGYTITKDSSDFGWPSGGIQIVPRPVGDLTLEITGGQELYSLQNLEEGTPYTAKVYYQGVQLTGEELETVDLKWDPDTSNVELRKEFAEDHYKLSLHYKNPEDPASTVCGECTVAIHAFYTQKGSTEAQTQASLTYDIDEDISPLRMELSVSQDYIVISELDQSEAIVARLTNNGAPLTPAEFAAVDFSVDCGGIDCTVTADEQNSAYRIQLHATSGISQGDYPIRATAVATDAIGRTIQMEDSLTVTLSNLPLWTKWVISLGILLLLFLIIWAILHIKVLPRAINTNKKDCTMNFDGENVTSTTAFTSKLEKGQYTLCSKFAGTKAGLVMEMTPGKESYLMKGQTKRYGEVRSASVRKYGNATVSEAVVGNMRYVLNEDTKKLERVPKNDKPFALRHGMTVRYSGTMLNAGVPKPFSVSARLNFKKK